MAFSAYRRFRRGLWLAGERTCGTTVPCVALVLFIGVCSSSAAPKKEKAVTGDFDKRIEVQYHQLDSIKTELQKGREKIRELGNQEVSHRALIDQLGKNITIAQDYLGGISHKIDTLGIHIDTLNASLVRAGDTLHARQAIMKLRLRNLYKVKDGPPIPLRLTSLSELLHQVHYFRDVNEYDRGLLVRIDSMRTSISGQKAFLEKKRGQLADLKNEKQREQKSLVLERESRESLLGQVRQKKQNYLAMISELETAQKELDKIITVLKQEKQKAKSKSEKERDKAATAAFVKSRGKLLWPVDGPVVTPFGKIIHPVYKTITSSNGIDIGCRPGERVVCVAKGVVAQICIMRGLGRVVIVDHGGYMTVYAHLEDVVVREKGVCEYGSVLGTVADGGSAGSTIHFEVYEEGGPVNPISWLNRKE